VTRDEYLPTLFPTLASVGYERCQHPRVGQGLCFDCGASRTLRGWAIIRALDRSGRLRPDGSYVISAQEALEIQAARRALFDDLTQAYKAMRAHDGHDD